MANPTTNFGWVMPTSSSLVTNLPADFNTFGQAVDTSMSELLGGTTGQVLSKTSNTNMDFTWVTPTDQTPLTTKGDLFTFSTVDARLGVGANNTVLTADSAEATGLKWATPSAAAFLGCSLYNSSSISAANNTYTLFTFNSELFDVGGFHSTSVNTGRVTIPAGKSGYYLINANITFLASSTGSRNVVLFINGSASESVISGIGNSASAANDNPSFSSVQYLNATDYIEIKGLQNSGGALDMRGAIYYTALNVTFLGA